MAMKLATVILLISCWAAAASASSGISLVQVHASFLSQQRAGNTPVDLEAGFRKAVEKHSNDEMRRFILNYLDSNGLRIHPGGENNFEGAIPWYSGVVASKSFKSLKSELRRAAWVVKKELETAPTHAKKEPETAPTQAKKEPETAPTQAKKEPETTPTQASAPLTIASTADAGDGTRSASQPDAAVPQQGEKKIALAAALKAAIADLTAKKATAATAAAEHSEAAAKLARDRPRLAALQQSAAALQEREKELQVEIAAERQAVFKARRKKASSHALREELQGEEANTRKELQAKISAAKPAALHLATLKAREAEAVGALASKQAAAASAVKIEEAARHALERAEADFAAAGQAHIAAVNDEESVNAMLKAVRANLTATQSLLEVEALKHENSVVLLARVRATQQSLLEESAEIREIAGNERKQKLVASAARFTKVASKRSNTEMKHFMLNYLHSNGLRIRPRGLKNFQSLIPWYSGVVANRSFTQFEREIRSVPWVVRRANAALLQANSESLYESSTIESSTDQFPKTTGAQAMPNWDDMFDVMVQLRMTEQRILKRLVSKNAAVKKALDNELATQSALDAATNDAAAAKESLQAVQAEVDDAKSKLDKFRDKLRNAEKEASPLQEALRVATQKEAALKTSIEKASEEDGEAVLAKFISSDKLENANSTLVEVQSNLTIIQGKLESLTVVVSTEEEEDKVSAAFEARAVAELADASRKVEKKAAALQAIDPAAAESIKRMDEAQQNLLSGPPNAGTANADALVDNTTIEKALEPTHPVSNATKSHGNTTGADQASTTAERGRAGMPRKNMSHDSGIHRNNRSLNSLNATRNVAKNETGTTSADRSLGYNAAKSETEAIAADGSAAKLADVSKTSTNTIQFKNVSGRPVVVLNGHRLGVLNSSEAHELLPSMEGPPTEDKKPAPAGEVPPTKDMAPVKDAPTEDKSSVAASNTSESPQPAPAEEAPAAEVAMKDAVEAAIKNAVEAAIKDATEVADADEQAMGNNSAAGLTAIAVEAADADAQAMGNNSAAGLTTEMDAKVAAQTDAKAAAENKATADAKATAAGAKAAKVVAATGAKATADAEAAAATNASAAAGTDAKAATATDAKATDAKAAADATAETGAKADEAAAATGAKTATATDAEAAAQRERRRLRRKARTLAQHAELAASGFAEVAATQSYEASQVFLQRLLQMKGFEVTNDRRYHHMMKFYNGACANGSYVALVSELHNGIQPASNCDSAFLRATKDRSAQKEDIVEKWSGLQDRLPTWRWLSSIRPGHGEARHEEAAGQHRAFGGFFGRLRAAVSAAPQTTLGDESELSEEGYRQVLAAEDAHEMTKFVRRAAAMEGLAITSERHLTGMVKFYDGECDAQSFAKLLRELHVGASLPSECGSGPWLRPA